MNLGQRLPGGGDDPLGPDLSCGDGLQELRRKADDLLSAADDALDRVLSGDSQSFLEAGRQSNAE
jgi:hypothetical protein